MATGGEGRGRGRAGEGGGGVEDGTNNLTCGSDRTAPVPAKSDVSNARTAVAGS